MAHPEIVISPLDPSTSPAPHPPTLPPFHRKRRDVKGPCPTTYCLYARAIIGPRFVPNTCNIVQHVPFKLTITDGIILEIRLIVFEKRNRDKEIEIGGDEASLFIYYYFSFRVYEFACPTEHFRVQCHCAVDNSGIDLNETSCTTSVLSKKRFYICMYIYM